MTELSLFWFPWCTSHYTDEYCDEKMQEVEDSGDYWGVRSVSGQIQIRVAQNPDAWHGDKLVECTFIDRREAIEKGLVA